MSPRVIHEMSDNGHSKVACYACRNRKVKCSKELPHCFNCFNCGQTCSYPSVMQKQGPKLGSVHKRRRVENFAQDRRHTAPQKRNREEGPTQNHKEEQRRSISPFREASGLDKDILLRSKHIQSVSLLITQSHESSSPESVRAVTPSTDIAVRRTHLISSCNELGVTSDAMEQM